MRPKPSTSWFTKKSSRVSPSPSPSIIFPHDQQNPNNGQTAIDPSSSNPSSQKNDTNETLSMLLRETHAALTQRSDRTNNNQTLCTKLASAIVIAEENESKQKGRRSHGNKRSSFITSLTDFDDELTNFFLYNYSDHHGDHESIHKILKGRNLNEPVEMLSPRSGGRHASVATLHLKGPDQLNHTVTSGKILDLLVQWDFNIFELYDLIGPNTFVIVGDGIVQHLHSLITTLGFNHDKFLTTLKYLSQSYLDNPYHNQLHGADVAQALSWTLIQGGAANVFTPVNDDSSNNPQQLLDYDKNRVPKITMLSSVLAALAHDAGHPGVNNNYLIDTSDPLALTYNDHSPLEHMHCATLFRILQKDECNFVPSELKEKSRAMRGVIVNMSKSLPILNP
jgi:hypothetical protein